MYPRKILVNVPQKKSKTNKSPIIISIISLCFAFGTFLFNYLDTQKIRIQSRSDFFAINASYLKIQLVDSLVETYPNKDISKIKISTSDEFELEKEPNYKELMNDTVWIPIKFNITNQSSERCVLLSYFSYKYPPYYRFNSQFINYFPDSIQKNNKFDYSRNRFYELLPNESFKAVTYLNKCALSDERFPFCFIILYKNTIGGLYAMSYEGLCYDINDYEHAKVAKDYKLEITQAQNSFRVFNEQEYSKITDKLSWLFEDNYVNKFANIRVHEWASSIIGEPYIFKNGDDEDWIDKYFRRKYKKEE